MTLLVCTFLALCPSNYSFLLQFSPLGFYHFHFLSSSTPLLLLLVILNIPSSSTSGLEALSFFACISLGGSFHQKVTSESISSMSFLLVLPWFHVFPQPVFNSGNSASKVTFTHSLAIALLDSSNSFQLLYLLSFSFYFKLFCMQWLLFII